MIRQEVETWTKEFLMLDQTLLFENLIVCNRNEVFSMFFDYYHQKTFPSFICRVLQLLISMLLQHQASHSK